MNPFFQLFPRIAILGFLILLGRVNLIAQQKYLQQSSKEIREIVIQHWSPDEGLSQGQINDMVVDHLGYLWVSTEKCTQIWFFVNFGERLLRNKKDSSIQNINTLLLLPFSYILNAKSFLEVGYK